MTIPLVVYDSLGNRTVIGTCDAKATGQGGWEISGIIESEQYKHLLQGKYDPDLYSVAFVEKREAKEVAYVPPPAISVSDNLKGTIPHQVIFDEVDWKDSNDD